MQGVVVLLDAFPPTDKLNLHGERTICGPCNTPFRVEGFHHDFHLQLLKLFLLVGWGLKELGKTLFTTSARFHNDEYNICSDNIKKRKEKPTS